MALQTSGVSSYNEVTSQSKTSQQQSETKLDHPSRGVMDIKARKQEEARQREQAHLRELEKGRLAALEDRRLAQERQRQALEDAKTIRRNHIDATTESSKS
jgi:membrane protein involved in colicin uptake